VQKQLLRLGRNFEDIPRQEFFLKNSAKRIDLSVNK